MDLGVDYNDQHAMLPTALDRGWDFALEETARNTPGTGMAQNTGTVVSKQ